MMRAAAVACVIAGSAQASPCSWDSPGANPYKGTVAGAIAAYQDIPLHERAALWVLVALNAPDARVHITRDGIVGGAGKTYSDLRDMHWGRSMCSGSVSMSSWAPDHAEPAVVYCVGGNGIVIPHVCGNVARVTCDPAPVIDEPTIPQHDDEPREVPEPGTLALVFAALVLMATLRPH